MNWQNITSWQDAVFSTGAAFFAVSLWAIIKNPQARVPRETSVPTAIIIGVFAFTHATLGLYWACGTEIVASLMWFWIGVKKATNGHPIRNEETKEEMIEYLEDRLR